MEPSLPSEETFLESEYESASDCPSKTSRTSTSVQRDAQGNTKLPVKDGEMTERARRGKSLPFFEFPQRCIGQKVERIEHGVEQLLYRGETIRDDIEEFKKDTNAEQESSQSSKPISTHNRKLPYLQTPARDDSTDEHSEYCSIPRVYSPAQDATKLAKQSQNCQVDQNTNMQSLQCSLITIRCHLKALETALSANITAQLLFLTGTTDISQTLVLDPASLTSFKVEKKDRATSAAVLNVAKVTCAVERGLEALIATLEIGDNGERGEKDDRERRSGLMDACLAKPEEVWMEMQRAIEGMRKVLKANAPHRKAGK